MGQGDFSNTIGAIFVAICYGSAGLFVGLILGTILGSFFMTGEGAAWSGISIGLPLGFLLAISAMIWGFRRTKDKFKPLPEDEFHRERRW